MDPLHPFIRAPPVSTANQQSGFPPAIYTASRNPIALQVAGGGNPSPAWVPGCLGAYDHLPPFIQAPPAFTADQISTPPPLFTVTSDSNAGQYAGGGHPSPAGAGFVAKNLPTEALISMEVEADSVTNCSAWQRHQTDDSSARWLGNSHLDTDASSSTNGEWFNSRSYSDAHTSSWNLEAGGVSNCYLPDLNSWSSSDLAWEMLDSNSNAGNLLIPKPTVTSGVCDSQLVPVARPPLGPATRYPNCGGNNGTNSRLFSLRPAIPSISLAHPDCLSSSKEHTHPPHSRPVASINRGGVTEVPKVNRTNKGFLQPAQLPDNLIEITFFKNVGRRKIDVILFDKYEYRRDSASEKGRPSQKWVCRYANKFDCKGGFRIIVQNQDDFLNGATISNGRNHTHDPFHMHMFNSDYLGYSTDDPCAVGAIKTEERPNAALIPARIKASQASTHLISLLHEEDFSADFATYNMDKRATSSPNAHRRGSNPSLRDLSIPSNTDGELETWDQRL